VIVAVVLLYCFYASYSGNGLTKLKDNLKKLQKDMHLTHSETESYDSGETESSNASTASKTGSASTTGSAGTAASAVSTPTAELTLYYAMWCGYSKMFLPEWEKFTKYAAANLHGLKVSSIRCEDGNEPVCSQKGVQGYPTIKLYLKNGQEVMYQGERNSAALTAFVKKYL
jgi:hypothetical protein